jgi:HPt (histidine-containing phosphotransfer) domain-containing protein
MSNHEPEAFNLTEALERVEGDMDLLKEMVDLFLEEYPRMVVAIEHALTTSNAQALQNAAHTLKGAVSNFSAYGATEASLTLEKMGRRQDFTNTATALSTLKHELVLLSSALEALQEKEAA